MTLFHYKHKWQSGAMLLLASVLAIASACNKPFPDTLQKDYGSADQTATERKTLVIIVDGAVVNIANQASAAC